MGKMGEWQVCAVCFKTKTLFSKKEKKHEKLSKCRLVLDEPADVHNTVKKKQQKTSLEPSECFARLEIKHIVDVNNTFY